MCPSRLAQLKLGGSSGREAGCSPGEWGSSAGTVLEAGPGMLASLGISSGWRWCCHIPSRAGWGCKAPKSQPESARGCEVRFGPGTLGTVLQLTRRWLQQTLPLQPQRVAASQGGASGSPGSGGKVVRGHGAAGNGPWAGAGFPPGWAWAGRAEPGQHWPPLRWAGLVPVFPWRLQQRAWWVGALTM